jgi:hypothetical protein
MAGRTARIAALIFGLTLVFGAGDAPALDISGPAPVQAAVAPLPTLPALGNLSAPALPVSPTSPTPAPAQPTPTTTEQPASAAVTESPSPMRRTAGTPMRVLREPHARLLGNEVRSGSRSGQPRRHVRQRPAHQGKRSRSPRPSRSRRPGLALFSPSRFDQLGQATEAGRSSPLLTGFGGDVRASGGLGWAVLLMAIMLPIGLCGFLQIARRGG